MLLLVGEHFVALLDLEQEQEAGLEILYTLWSESVEHSFRLLLAWRLGTVGVRV